MESFIDTYGLVKSRPLNKTEENAFLFTLELILIREMAGKPAGDLISAFKRSMEKCRVSTGVFLQTPSHADSKPVHERDKSMSHDQITAMMAFSVIKGQKYHEELWTEIARQGYFRYDNQTPDDPKKILHPRDMIFYGMCNNSKFAALFAPLLVLACFLACMKKKETTSGKLLSWVRCQALMRKSLIMRFCFKGCTYLVGKRNGGWANVFEIYFNYPNHPTTVTAKEVY